jgi:hypothetical protein
MTAVDELCRSYLDVRWHFDPAAASGAGRLDLDGRLGRYDEETVRQHLVAVRALAGAAEELDADSVQEEIDRTALLDDMRVLGFRFEYEQPHRRNPCFWLSHIFDGVHAVLGRGDDDASLAGPLVARLRDVPAFLDAAVATLKSPPDIFSETALAMLGGGGSLVAAAVQRFGALAPELAPELDAAGREALVALRNFGAALRDRIPTDTNPHAFAVGEEQFERRLRHEHALLAGAPELWRYGLRLREEVEAELTALAHEIDPGRSWREVVQRLREEGAPTEAGLLSGYQGEVARAHRFLEQRQVVSLTDVPLEVVATPPYLRPMLPFAAYDMPPVLLPGRPGRFFVTEPDPASDASSRARQLREHARHGLPSLIAHEAWPGHHLQLTRAQGLTSEVRRHVWSPLTVEGWALYCEGLMEELGFYPTREVRLFRLVDLLWRAVRIDIDIGLHTRGMSAGEAVGELRRRLPMEQGDAAAEVRRYCQMPTYQLCYAVGRRDLLALRDEVREVRGAAFDLRAFHDEVLSYGGLPVSLIRWGMGVE